MATVVLNGFVATATKADSFMMKAAQSDMLEIMSSQTALQKSSNEEVRRFAQMMIDDHTRTSDELRTLAASKNVTLPTAMSGKQQSMVSKLNSAAAGMEFDREYMKMQVRAHEDAVKLFQKQANDNDAEDADARAFAAKHLPALQGHLTMARTMSNGMRGMSGGNRSGNMNGNMNSGGMNMNSGENMNMNSNGNMNGSMNSNGNRNTNGNSNRNRNNNRNTNSNGNTNSNSNMNSNVNM
jgi:putative membrane protein